jgi:DNA segregation ATPase FtsK/SpoIIIE, S-DNA-T family
MERRYSLLDSLNVRDLPSYNRKAAAMQYARERLPNIVVIIDEFADLMTTTGKELEGYLARLAAMARAVGIHLVLATQRPSTNVITGIIKANIPSRIAFMVTSNTDSRIIIDQPGAEKLLGRGDMLFSSSWDPIPSRIQGAFLTEEEVERVVAHVKAQGEPDYLDEEYFRDDDEDDEYEGNESDDSDDLMQEALKIVSQRGSASASYLQRRLKIGYNRAARLVEEMEERGIVGPAQGSKPREVIRMPGLE